MNELFSALSKAQSAMRAAELDKANPHFNSRYASLASVWSAIRKPLTDNGLAITQTFSTSDNRLLMLTRLTHSSGQSLESVYPIEPDKKTAQAIGSCITYARRYCISALIGLTADEDDDGNEASSPAPAKRPEAKAQPLPTLKAQALKVEAPKGRSPIQPTPERKVLFSKIAEQVKTGAWTYEQLKQYSIAAFGVEASNELQDGELKLLVSVCESTTFAQALAEQKAMKDEDVL